jgi:radical SAM protein with 4Fe4S-binding SPASM domain
MDRPACAALWFTPMVHVDGGVTTCCLDEHLVNRLGNVRDTALAELWSGPTIQAWRRAQAEGRFAESGPYCTRCNWRSAGAMDPADVRAWLAEQAGA